MKKKESYGAKKRSLARSNKKVNAVNTRIIPRGGTRL